MIDKRIFAVTINGSLALDRCVVQQTKTTLIGSDCSKIDKVKDAVKRVKDALWFGRDRNDTSSLKLVERFTAEITYKLDDEFPWIKDG